ncbi:MAG: hypothetical protein ACXWCY_19710 [Burkholderiales bacterium]
MGELRAKRIPMSEPTKGKHIRRQDLWRKQYRHRRYMEFLSADELQRRFADVLTNTTTLTEEGRIGFPTAKDDIEFWFSRFTHLMEEYAIRGLSFPHASSLTSVRVPRATWPAPPHGVKSFQDLNLTPQSFLNKFSRRKYLEPMLRHGRVRITGAASYHDPSLNAAIRDDELSLAVEALPTEVRIQAIDPTTGRPVTLQPRGNVSIRTALNTDYYVYCLSQVFHPRLFDDFEADACLVIKDGRQFAQRLSYHVIHRIGEWPRLAGPVTYVDPLMARSPDHAVTFAKHFRYTYQKEFRLVWMPPTDVSRLSPLFLEIGSLEDIAVLIH